MVWPDSLPWPSEIATQRPSTHCQRTLSPACAVDNRHGTYIPVLDIGPVGGLFTFGLDNPFPSLPRSLDRSA
jgi:hypothetical protein